MYFSGTFEHTLDDRGRIAVPAAFRPAFLAGATLRPTPEGCIELYTAEGFETEVRRRLTGDDESSRTLGARRTRRSFLADALPADLDKQGRIVIPPALRAATLPDAKVSIIGCGDFMEIWASERWAREREAIAAIAAQEAGA